MKNRYFLAALTLSLSCFAFAEPVSEPHAAFLKENQSSTLEGVLAEANARLNLTDEQAEQVAPILHSNFEAQRAVFEHLHRVMRGICCSLERIYEDLQLLPLQGELVAHMVWNQHQLHTTACVGEIFSCIRQMFHRVAADATSHHIRAHQGRGKTIIAATRAITVTASRTFAVRPFRKIKTAPIKGTATAAIIAVSGLIRHLLKEPWPPQWQRPGSS